MKCYSVIKRYKWEVTNLTQYLTVNYSINRIMKRKGRMYCEKYIVTFDDEEFVFESYPDMEPGLNDMELARLEKYLKGSID